MLPTLAMSRAPALMRLSEAPHRLLFAQLDEKGRDVRAGHGCIMLSRLWLSQKAARDRSHRSLGLAVALGKCPIEDDPDALAHAARGLGPGQPYFGKKLNKRGSAWTAQDANHR
jgi:hypothetical protein